MDDQDALTALLVATHPARLELLNYLRRGESALSTIRGALVHNENVRKHVPGGNDESVKHCIGFFLTDLENHGLVKSEMRPNLNVLWTITSSGNYQMDDQWYHLNLCGAVYYPPDDCTHDNSPTHCNQVHGDMDYYHPHMNGTSVTAYPQYTGAERWYWMTELGEHALSLIKTYLGLTKWIEEESD